MICHSIKKIIQFQRILFLRKKRLFYRNTSSSLKFSSGENKVDLKENCKYKENITDLQSDYPESKISSRSMVKSISKEQSAVFKRFSTFKISPVPINQILPKSNSNSNMLIHYTI